MEIVKQKPLNGDSTEAVSKKKSCSISAVLALIAAVLLLLLSGCAGKPVDVPAAPTDANPPAASDPSDARLDDKTLLGWLKDQYTFDQLCGLGYELELVENMTDPEFPDDNNRLYRIKDTEIYLSTVIFYNEGDGEHWLEDRVVAGIAAPAEVIAPALIGEKCLPVHSDSTIYWPNGYLFHYGDGKFVADYFPNTSTQVSKDTMVGVICQSAVFGNDWQMLVESVYAETVRLAAKETYGMGAEDRAEVAAENDTHYLVRVFAGELTAKDVCAWYRIEKESKTVTLIKEGAEAHLAEDIARLHPEIAKEFPGIYADGSMDA